MIKHDTFNDKFSSRLTQSNNHNDFKLVLSYTHVCLFSISIQISFGSFLQIVKQQTVSTCKIGYN